MTGPTQKIDGERDRFAGWNALRASVRIPQIPAASSHNRETRQDSDRECFDLLSGCVAGWDAFTHSRQLPDATTSQKPLDAGGDTAKQAK
jgi:hypothetical protein